MMSESTYVKRAEVVAQDEKSAVDAFAERIRQPDMAGVIFFCSSNYDPARLGQALREQFTCPVIGCTTAGGIGSTYQQNGIVGLSLSAEMFRMHAVAIDPLNEFSNSAAEKLASKLRSELQFSDSLDSKKMFGFLLIDGLSCMEEQVIASIYNSFDSMPIIGGSAGDDLRFEETRVYVDGEFRSGAAVFSIIETHLLFKTFRLHHFEPTEKDFVITGADPSRRIVTEIDGSPAAEEYAKIIGLDIDKLSPQVFTTHPTMLQIGNEWYVRSVKNVNEDGSLSFACAIDIGLPLTIAKGIGFVETLRQKVDEIEAEFSSIEFTLGCDCAFRLIEMLETGVENEVEQQIKRINFIGFSTYGEQFNSIHVNQTLTGVVVGKLKQ
jgi:hypothetical protein